MGLPIAGNKRLGRTLKVEAELGDFEASFTNLRLIVRRDLKVLIPPVDA